jgi:hypothetical protein
MILGSNEHGIRLCLVDPNSHGLDEIGKNFDLLVINLTQSTSIHVH